MLAEKIVHLPASIGRGIAEAEAGQNPRQLRELAGGAAFDRPVEGIVRPRRHFVEQQPAIGVDKELHGEQADKINRIGECLGRRLCGLCQHWRDRRWRDGSCQNSAFMPVLACREMADAASGITRQKGADLAVKGDHFLENGVIAVQVLQRCSRSSPGLIRRCPLPSYPRRHVFRMAGADSASIATLRSCRLRTCQ